MVRIFSHLQGLSFINNRKKIEVSPLSSATSSSASRAERSIATTLTRQSSSTTPSWFTTQATIGFPSLEINPDWIRLGSQKRFQRKGKHRNTHSHLLSHHLSRPLTNRIWAQTARRQLLIGAVRLLHWLCEPGGQILLQQQRQIRTGRHEELNQWQKLLPYNHQQLELQKRKSAGLPILDPNSTYDLFGRHKITDEEVEKTSFCSKMNPLPSGKHRIASHHKAVRYFSQLPSKNHHLSLCHDGWG